MDTTKIKKVITTGISAAIQSNISYLTSFLAPFLAQNPYWELCFYSAIGLYGVFMAVNQARVEEVVNFIQKHPHEFRKEIVESEEFKGGFLVFIDQYLKQRLKNKREIQKKIFLGFSVLEDKESFELERLNNVLANISLDSLEVLATIKKEIIPGIEQEIELELSKVNPNSDRSIDWWRDFHRHNKSVWQPISKWLEENYSPESAKVKERFGNPKNEGWIGDLLNRASNQESDVKRKYSESRSELVNLGILRLKVTGSTIGGAADYLMNNFGYKFLEFIDTD